MIQLFKSLFHAKAIEVPNPKIAQLEGEISQNPKDSKVLFELAKEFYAEHDYKIRDTEKARKYVSLGLA